MESLKVGGQTLKANYHRLYCLHSLALILILLLLGHRIPCEKQITRWPKPTYTTNAPCASECGCIKNFCSNSCLDVKEF